MFEQMEKSIYNKIFYNIKNTIRKFLMQFQNSLIVITKLRAINMIKTNYCILFSTMLLQSTFCISIALPLMYYFNT